MEISDNEVRQILNAMARLLGETVAHVAYSGAFDGTDQAHLIGLLDKLDSALRVAHIRGADEHLAEAKNVLRDPENRRHR